MAQLQCMDACLDILSDELCQVNTRVGHIARQQAVMGGFVSSPPPTLGASEVSKVDDTSDDDDDNGDGDASFSSTDEMSI